jgi:hypothetical protein
MVNLGRKHPQKYNFKFLKNPKKKKKLNFIKKKTSFPFPTVPVGGVAWPLAQ